jgi:hypothetical protein
MLVNLGARHIAVISRSGKPPAGKSLLSVEKWKAAGIDINAHAADVANFSQLQVRQCKLLLFCKHFFKGYYFQFELSVERNPPFCWNCR